MTKCRFWENRYQPIEYSLEDIQSTEGYFSLCLLKKGNAVLSIDGKRCYLSAPALLVLGSYAAGGQLYGKHNNNHKCKQFFHNKLLFQIDKMLFIGYTGIIAIIRLIVHFFLSMIFALSAIGEL